MAHTTVDHLPVPDWVLALSPERRAEPHYQNENGGITYRLSDGTYVKVEAPGPEWDVEGLCARLTWVRRFVAAPLLLRTGTADGLDWVQTRALPGQSIIDGDWRTRPETAVPALGRALRALHDALPVDGCSFSWSVPRRVERFGLPRTFIDDAPAPDLVVCHGDACNPNFLLDDDGSCTGYIDLGDLGTADRWADLAPAVQSLRWNFGGVWEGAFLRAYGIDRDDARLAFYTDLWNAES